MLSNAAGIKVTRSVTSTTSIPVNEVSMNARKKFIYNSFLVSISFPSSPPNSLVVFVTLTKVKAVLNCIVVVFVVHD